MNKERIVVFAGTYCDVPQAFVKQYHMYIISSKVVYKDAEYLDGVDTTPEQIYRGLEGEVPKASLPSGERITEIFDQIQADGFQKVTVITLSSSLGGTNNTVRLITSQLEDTKIFIMDTKDISIDDGFHTIQTTRYIENGLSFGGIKARLMRGINQCKVLSVVKVLEYLQKGGRISLAAPLSGSALSPKPIASCNDEGIYYTVAEVRGREQSIAKTKELTLDFAQGHKRYNIAIMHGDTQGMAEEIRDCIIEKLPGTDVFIMKQVFPVLGMHTGPGTPGICVQIPDET